MKEIILASASPRRKELLQGLGLPHTVITSQVAEQVPEHLEPVEVAKALALQKAEDVAGRVDRGLVIGADTIVVLETSILGKPSNQEEAVSMLRRLSGRAHLVMTGVAIVDTESGKKINACEITQVVFRELDDSEVLAYVETGEPMDKAGAYGIQGLGALLVQEIRGCYFNVVGLPLTLLSELLKDFGIHILKMNSRTHV